VLEENNVVYTPPSPVSSVRAMLLLLLADQRRGGDWLTDSVTSEVAWTWS
jgi:hypothetical protein